MNTPTEKMTFAELVTSSVLARGLALLILALALLGAIAVALFDLLLQRAVPQMLIDFIFMGLSAAFTVTGISFGVVLQPSRGALPIPTATAPLVPQITPVSEPAGPPAAAPAGQPATAN